MQHDFILLDRSGSMMSLWTEAISSVNAYVKKLADDKVDTGVTLVAFDLGPDGKLSFDIVRDRIIPSTWRPVTEMESPPRGSTPLSDAVGRICDLANAGNYDKVAIIVMTDGHENASRELSVLQAKAKLDQCRAKNWQVIFLGADFDNTSQAAGYGTKSANMASVSKGKLGLAMAESAHLRSAYAATGASMDFSDQKKADLGAA